MNNERLVITLKESEDPPYWAVAYQGWVEMPNDTYTSVEAAGGTGQSEVWVETEITQHNKVVHAIDAAKQWASGCGFKASTLRPEYGNTFHIRLRRP